MSSYVDKFIKQHKEYFQRNKIVIDNNPWNQTKVTEDKIQELFDRIAELKKKNTKSSEKEIKSLQTEIFKTKEAASKRKSTLFAEETELTSSILGRLSAFIKETEKSGDRNLNKVQKFIDSTVAIIDIHLDKCDSYLNYSMDDLVDNEEDSTEELELRSEEIKFQDGVFTKKIKIEDTLNSLNITNSIDNVAIEFFKGQKASLPMMHVLPHYDDDIKTLTENLVLPEEVIDNTFHIHQDPDKIPKWNRHKHYWEQSQEVLDYWYNEWLKITKGFTVDGYFFHPWLYYHLNFFKTKIPQKEGGDDIVNPSLRDNEWFIAEQLKAVTLEDGYYTKEGLLIYGSRRIAKSTTMASICEWRSLVVSNVSTAITSGSDGDLDELTNKIKTAMRVKEPAFKLYIHKQEWAGGSVEIGLKSDPSTLIEHSRHTIKNLSGGAKTSTQKGAGGAPSVYLIEEIGKFAWEKSYLAAVPSYQTEFGFKTIVIAVGTGGEASLSGDSMRILANPKLSKFREMDWEMLEKTLPEGFKPTWKKRVFGTFMPGQMGYKFGFKRIERKFGEFLGIKSKFLDKITIHQTDWETNTKIILEDRKAVEKDSLKLQQETVQYPIDPEECFLSADKNPFKYEQARKQKEFLEESGLWDRRREVILTGSGKLKAELSNQDLAPFPHPGGIVKAPLLIFEDIPEQTPVDNLYVASFDDVKQDDSDTDSLISFQVWKMDTFGDEWGDNLVLSWACRPESRREMYETWLLIQKTYNAKAFPENEDMGYKTFLEGKHLDDQWLLKAVDFTASMNITNNGKRKYGWTPRQSKKVLLGMFIEFCNEVIEVEQEDGTVKTMYGVQKIQDIGLLDEIINYKEDGNFDRISAALGAVGWMHYLKKNWILPKQRRSSNEETKKRQVNKNSLYTKSRAGSLYRKSLNK